MSDTPPEPRTLPEKAERLVRRLAEQTGAQVPASMVRAKWAEAYPGRPVPNTVQRRRWGRLFGPGVTAGRIRKGKVQGQCLYSPADQDLPLPEPYQGRTFSAALVERSRAAERALAEAVRRHGHAVTGAQCRAVWEAVNDAPFRPNWQRRWKRLLAPGIQAGRVVVRVREGKRHRNLFLPVSQKHLPNPRWTTDEDRIREALRRACRRYESAVPHDLVALEVQAAPDLHLEGKIGPANVLGNLRRRGEIHGIRVHHRGASPRWYYLPNDRSLRVRVEVRLPMDRRWDAVQAFWQANGGLPFSTRALRRYLNREEWTVFEDDPNHAWTLALHHLERLGVILKFPRHRRRWALWAPRAAWERLDPAERNARLHDVLRETSGPIDGSDPDVELRRRYDPGFVSRNNNMRVLFERARNQIVAREPDPQRRRILEARPLTAGEVSAEVDEDHPLRPEGDFALAMVEAARLRPGMVRTELQAVALVKGRAYYELGPSESGAAYVRWKTAREAADVPSCRAAVGLLRQANTQADSAALPVASGVLRARRDDLVARCSDVREELEVAQRDASLLEEERTDAAARMEELEHLVEALHDLRIADSPPSAQQRADEHLDWDRRVPTYDIGRAWEEVSLLELYGERPPRELPALLPGVPVVDLGPEATGAGEGAEKAGRPQTTDFDRLGYVAYALQRWCGRRLRLVAQLATWTMGELRVMEPFLGALENDRPTTHAGAAAVLALFGEPAARSALVRYVERHLEEDPAVALPAVELGLLGLLPMPFGPGQDRLGERERAVLTQVWSEAADSRLRSVADSVLGIWDGDVDPEVGRELYGPAWWAAQLQRGEAEESGDVAETSRSPS